MISRRRTPLVALLLVAIGAASAAPCSDYPEVHGRLASADISAPSSRHAHGEAHLAAFEFEKEKEELEKAGVYGLGLAFVLRLLDQPDPDAGICSVVAAPNALDPIAAHAPRGPPARA